MTIKPADKASAKKMMSQSKPADISIFHVNQTEAKSATIAVDAIKAKIAREKCDYEIVLIKK
jgi:chaperone required for assembly of F1-ATPase